MNASIDEYEEEEAALWVARHMGGPVDATAFSEWLAGGQGRRELFDAMWASCMDDAVTAALQSRGTDQDNEPLFQADRAEQRSHLGRRAVAFGAVAASLAAVLAFSWQPLRFALAPAQTYETGPGQVREVTLADGSIVVLNGASSIQVTIAGERRYVKLQEGEALFEVRHDKERPFTVAAGDGRVTVLGTRFDLALNGEQVDLEVTRGLVRFAGQGGDASGVLVPAAHRSALVKGRPTEPERFDVQGDPAWRGGWLEVADMPLERLVPRLERWTGKTIVVQDRSLLAKRVAGRFRLSEPGVVLESLGVIYGFSVRETPQSYLIETQ
ncbi:FecR domain-containing protein [Erythrobacter sp. SG61-1L]|uniref:FecR family protein n=1 Tax=Erythrobacter sp. SG61-1L TaxID=1603897 RepID=UPI0006C9053E|nr:FecR domain-containing protein [Erythrobacter sp. SG61-1L]